jgi:hypothetical protein
MKKALLLLAFFWSSYAKAQVDFFPYILEINPIEIPNLPGLHSYAFAQHEGKWLIIGGRTDGLHARTPNTAFPAASNNTNIYVVDIKEKQFWSASINQLSTDLREQLQTTNMNFIQDGTILYFAGGYAFSESRGNHVTFPFLTAIDVYGLIEAVVNQSNISPYFIQVQDERFAVAGGQMGKIEDVFYLIGGNRFDGRYNPFGGPSYSQEYTNQIRKFKIAPTIGPLAVTDYETITDPVHLRRRDYNLVPQVFAHEELGYMISSGVFQINANLPFLYPVDITKDGYTPRTTFNQYLSNYHGAKVGVYDKENEQMHSLFFGGMSQYYYQNGELIQDNLVPFTKTISRVTRYQDGSLKEYLLPVEMPNLQGASAEFIPNLDLPLYANKVVKLSDIKEESFVLGHIYGGITSPTRNPFSNNQTNTTSAEPSIFEVKLIKSPISSILPVDGSNPFDFLVFPNPFDDMITIRFQLNRITKTDYFITNGLGQIIKQGNYTNQEIGRNDLILSVPNNSGNQILILTVIFEDKFYVSKKLLKNQ